MQGSIPAYKWIFCHLGNAVRYVDTYKRRAAIKRPVSNVCHTVRYVDGSQ